jgi:hypothetical protein
MNVCSITYRYALLRAEIQRRLTNSGKWSGLPGLLDELNALRSQYQANTRAQG